MKTVQTWIALTAIVVTTASMGFAQNPQPGPSGQPTQDRQCWGCDQQGQGRGNGKGKQMGPRDGSGPRHPAGTGGGQGQGRCRR